MFSLTKGRPIARIVGGDFDNEIIHIFDENVDKDKCCNRCSIKCKKKACCGGCEKCYSKTHQIGKEFSLREGSLKPLLNIRERQVDYNAGPSGSGKTTIAAEKIKSYRKIFPEKELFIFSRANIANDPALKGLGGAQIKIDESLIENPIDIEKELSGGCIILFDDCNTIQNEKFKTQIDRLMSDIMEVGRKLDITVIITNHLVIPNEKKFARTILNEMQTLTIFPKSGAGQQIRYALKQYFGLNNKQIDTIFQLPSRWVQISKTYPIYVLHEKGAYLI